jgi:polysaccharide pyruvyl transferase CsaB
MGILVAGYYGYRNWGDEGSLATLLQVLPREAVCALSGDPAFTEATYGICALPRLELRTVRRAIRESDALILGGGSLLQDATSLRSLLYYLALIRWGLRAHGRVLLVGQGVGPLRRRLGRRLTARLLQRVPFLSVRDADSARLLSSLGVSGATVDADLTWALAPQPAHVALDAGARWVGLAPRLWADAPVQRAFADLCRRLHAEGYRSVADPDAGVARPRAVRGDCRRDGRARAPRATASCATAGRHGAIGGDGRDAPARGDFRGVSGRARAVRQL